MLIVSLSIMSLRFCDLIMNEILVPTNNIIDSVILLGNDPMNVYNEFILVVILSLMSNY